MRFASVPKVSETAIVPKVTPQMQCQMRTEQTKGLKRGRKPKGKKTGKAEKAPKRKVLKRSIKAKNKKGAKSKSKSKPKSPGNKGGGEPSVLAEPTGKKPRKSKTKQQAVEPSGTDRKPRKSNSDKEADPAKKHGKHMQERVTGANGKWVYEVLPDQTLGCSNCRFIFGGCKLCQKPGFRGKSAQTMRLEQQAAKEGLGEGESGEGWEGWTWDEDTQDWIQAEEKAPTKAKAVKTKKKRTRSSK